MRRRGTGNPAPLGGVPRGAWRLAAPPRAWLNRGTAVWRQIRAKPTRIAGFDSSFIMTALSASRLGQISQPTTQIVDGSFGEVVKHLR